MKMKILTSCLTFVVLLFETGCVRLDAPVAQRNAKPLPEWVTTGLGYKKVLVPEAILAPVSLRHRLYTARTNTIIVREFGVTNVIESDFYLPKGKIGPFPVVIILPISAGGKYPLENFFARYFVKHGFAVLIVHRESERNPTSSEDINRIFRQALIDSSRVIDWVETRPELDSKSIVLMGTSLGGIKGAALVATEPRLKAAVLGLCGGDLAKIIARSTDGQWKSTEAKPRGIFGKRNAYLAKNHLTQKEFEEKLHREVVWSPDKFAASVETEKVFLILGGLDTVVPFETGWRLRKAMGKPRTKVLLSGHYTALFYLVDIRASALRFFNEKLGRQ